MEPHRKLLVLDLDETLVHAREVPLARDADFLVGPWHVYRRPHLEAFVESVVDAFDVAVWTASGEAYAARVVSEVFPPGLLKFTWSSERCTTVRDWASGNYATIKDLRKVRKHGYRMEHVVAVDDTPFKYKRSYGNLVAVKAFEGDTEDRELPLLARYLRTLVPATNVRAVEKRNWRTSLSPDTE